MASEKALQSVGLLTNPNRNALPPGALLVADNTVVDQQGTVQPRPGYRVVAATESISDFIVSRIVSYNAGPAVGGVLVDYLPNSDKAIITTNPGGFSLAITGFQSAVIDPHPYEAMIARGNLYSTGGLGMQKLFLPLGPGVLPAGMPRGLPASTSVGAAAPIDGVAWLSDSNTVAYRTCLVRTDAFGYETRGAPCGQLRVSNRTGSDGVVTLVIPLPDLNIVPVVLLIPGDVLEVYRSAQVTTSTTEPPDDMNLVATYIITSADITAGSVTIIDAVSDFQRQTQPLLYTSPSAEGIAAANETPPFCSDCCFGNRLAFYGDINTRPFFSLSLFGNGGYAWDGNAHVGKHAMQVTLTTVMGSTTATVTAGTVLVGQCVNDSTAPTLAGTHLSGDTIVVSNNGSGFPTETTIHMSKAALASGNFTATVYDVVHVGGRDYFASDTTDVATRQFDNATTPSSLDEVVEHFCFIVNSDELGEVWAHPNQLGLTSAGITYPDDGSPGVVFYGRTMAQYNVAPYLDKKVTETVNSTKPVALLGLTLYGPQDFVEVSSPVLTPTVFPDRLTNASQPGGVYVSKQDEPEAVPVENLIQVGDTNARVIRMIPVREAVWVFKEDGLFRIASNGDITTLSVNLIDPSVKLLNSYAADAMNDNVFAWTSTGVQMIGDGGAQNISQAAIGADLSAMEQMLAPNGTTPPNAFLVCDSNQSRVLVGVPTAVPGDGVETPDVPTMVYCYSTRTSSWSRWLLPDNGPYAACLDNVVSGRVVMSGRLDTSSEEGPSSVRAHYFERQRIASTYTADYDEPITVVTSTPNGLGQFVVTSNRLTKPPAAGDVYVNADGSVATVISGANLVSSTVCLTDIAVDVATVEYYHAFQSDVQWAPFDMNEFDIEKTWREIRLLLDATENMISYKMTFTGTPNGSSAVVSVPIVKTTTPLNIIKRIGIPRNVGRQQLLLMQLTIRQGLALWELDGVSAVAVPSADRVGR